MVLTKGDLEKVGEKVHEITTKSWNRVEYCYNGLFTGVLERIVELKLLALSIRQPAQIQERITKGMSIVPTLAVRLTQIPARALQFKLV